jgi:hypothetical protein
MIGERYNQTISNLCQAGLLRRIRRCEFPPINESAELTLYVFEFRQKRTNSEDKNLFLSTPDTELRYVDEN